METNIKTETDERYEKTNDEVKKLVDDVGKGLKAMLESTKNKEHTDAIKNNSNT